MAQDKVLVSAKVMKGMEAVRVSGKTNMLAVSEVIHLAQEMGFPETAAWISDNRLLYTWGVLLGFHLEPDKKKEDDDAR